MTNTDMTGAQPAPRQTLLTRTFVELADTLVADFDVVELLALLVDRCVEVFGVAAAGIMLAAPDGELRVMASSSETMHCLELFELQAREGPCLDCYRSGQPVTVSNLADGSRWPRFAAEALAAGFHFAQALPMSLRGTTIGALNLFHNETIEMSAEDLGGAQALASVATIAILQHRASIEAQTLNQQLQHALNSRIVVEQAKGILAERDNISMEQAFTALRALARTINRQLVEAAETVISGAVDIRAPGAEPAPHQDGPSA